MLGWTGPRKELTLGTRRKLGNMGKHRAREHKAWGEWGELKTRAQQGTKKDSDNIHIR